MADVLFDIVKIGLGALAGCGATVIYNRLKADKATANQCRDKLDSLCTLAEKAIRYREVGSPNTTTEMDTLVERTELGILLTRRFGNHQGFSRVQDGLLQLDFALEAIESPARNASPRVPGASVDLLRTAQRVTRSAIYECIRDSLWRKALGGHQLQP